MSYSQYDVTSDIVDSTGSSFECEGLVDFAVRYGSGSFAPAGDYGIAFNTTGTSGNLHVWRDNGSLYPSHFSTSANGPWTFECNDAATIYMASDSNGSGAVSFTSPHFQYYSSGGGGGFLSNDPSVTNLQYNKASDGSVSISFDWANISNFVVYVLSGGTTTASSASAGSGTSGSKTHTVTSLNEGDKVWIAVSGLGDLASYIHKKVLWSLGKVGGVKSVIAKTFLYDTTQSYDGFLGSPLMSPVDITHDGTEQTVSTPWTPNTTFYIQDFGENDYGSSYTTGSRWPGQKASSNFW